MAVNTTDLPPGYAELRAVLEILAFGIEGQAHRCLPSEDRAGYAYAARLLRAADKLLDARDPEASIHLVELIAENPDVRLQLVRLASALPPPPPEEPTP